MLFRSRFQTIQVDPNEVAITISTSRVDTYFEVAGITILVYEAGQSFSQLRSLVPNDRNSHHDGQRGKFIGFQLQFLAYREHRQSIFG